VYVGGKRLKKMMYWYYKRENNLRGKK